MIHDLLTQERRPFLRWWLLVTLMILAAIGALEMGIVEEVYNVDVTKLSFLIAALLSTMSVKCGIDTFKLTSKQNITEYEIEKAHLTSELGWFVSDFCLTLGMIGTVGGFIFMLASSFAEIDVTNVASLQNVLSHMAAGMGTALYTTAAGLISSAFLKLQYFNYSSEVERLGAEIDPST